jgi:DnaJ-class molecular chaperone with C-terminal Zn finger domain
MTRNQALARLGLTTAASADEIKHAYRKLAFELHPDLHPDNPNAGKEFQLLNEAYVFLTSPPTEGTGPRAQTRAQAQADATERARADAHRAYERAKSKLREEQKTGAKKSPGEKKPPASEKPGAEKTREMKREEVLQDLLRDPFARRVFEDIYTQIQEEAARKQPGRNGKAAAYAEPGLLERTAGGVSDWLRRQIDEEQTVRVAGPLTPGKRLRLQVHQGVFGKSHTLELTLPPGFEPNRPIRLKGMGKRIGKWQGDLYLRIIN